MDQSECIALSSLLKFLYEHFKDDINQTGEIFANYFPEIFLKLEFKEQATLNAK